LTVVEHAPLTPFSLPLFTLIIQFWFHIVK